MKSYPTNGKYNDIYLASFLKASGVALTDATVDPAGRVTFIFPPTTETNELVQAYFKGEALINPVRLVEEFRNLRTFVYSLSQNESEMKNEQNSYRR